MKKLLWLLAPIMVVTLAAYVPFVEQMQPHPPASSITIGDTVVEASADNGNGNLLLAQQATLAQSATIQSLSFYVTTASGNLRLGIYTDASGKPGTLQAQTNSFAAVAGWNTQNVITPATLAAGTYWLAYLPSSNSLAFRKQNTSGSCWYVGFTYAAMPATFPSGPTSCSPATWSFYATLRASGPLPVNGQCGLANGVPTSSAPTGNLCSVGTASSVTGTGPWNWSCVGSNGGSTASCSAPVQGVSSGTSFTPVHTYFISTTGSDNNNGASTSTAWATPNHAVACGDVIVVGPGSYNTNTWNFGTVSNCPSTTGGIDGAGGVYFAVLLCGGADLVSCKVNNTNNGWGIDITTNNWAVEGFLINGANGGSPGHGGMAADGAAATIHHTAFINNVVYDVGIGFAGLDSGVAHDVPGATGFDYTAFVGNIAQNAQQDIICTAAMAMAGPATVDTAPGTHYLWYGNFAWNQPNNGCPYDIENYIVDTWDAHGVTNQTVILNNIGWSAFRYGMHIYLQDFNSVAGLHDYVENNTFFNNNLINNGFAGDMNFNNANSTAPTFTIVNNISLSTQSSECAILVGGANGPGSLANITVGTSGNENIVFALNGGSAECAFNGYSFSNNNFQVNPNFTNTTDLLNNRTGAPNCGGFVSVTACMGWNADTQVLTTPSVISDLTPTCTNCGGKGYQKPAGCVSSGPFHDLYPAWLKGIVYLHASGFTDGAMISENGGLVTRPCGL